MGCQDGARTVRLTSIFYGGRKRKKLVTVHVVSITYAAARDKNPRRTSATLFVHFHKSES